jgi:hypothetical protein
VWTGFSWFGIEFLTRSLLNWRVSYNKAEDLLSNSDPGFPSEDFADPAEHGGIYK